LQLNDPHLEAIAVSLETDAVRWPDAMARHALIDLFPGHLPVPRLLNILRRVKENGRTVGNLNYRLPSEIEAADLSPEYLDQLRQGLTALLVDGATWEHDKLPHLRTKRPDLLAALVAVCHRQCVQRIRTEPWVSSTLLAVRLSTEEHNQKEGMTELRRALANLPADVREAAFWNEDAFLAHLHESTDAWNRVYDLASHGGIQLNDEKDAGWVRRRLSDVKQPLDHREMMLWLEMVFLNRTATDHRELLEEIKPLVSDAPSLVSIIDNRMKAMGSAELRRQEAQTKKLSSRLKDVQPRRTKVG
jgi:hypothetical protein